MTYGLNPALFVENGAAIHAANAQARRSSDEFRAWQAMDKARRLSLVERALSPPANDDSPDGYPLAL